jgi:CheY-like chemotaxis protein
MSQVIAGNTIEKVGIVEDDPSNRKSLAEIVSDAQFVPVPEDGPLCDLKSFTRGAMRNTDAFIFDHHLKQSQYAPFDGAEAVAFLYKQQFPSLLCTQWSNADIDTMRRYRRYIPALIPTDDLDPCRIVRELEVCINEINGNFLPSRQPVKTIVRIENVDQDQKPPIVYVVVPAWNPRQVVRFPIDVIDPRLHTYVAPDSRFFAQVNLGAEDQFDLFFDKFDYRG